MVLRRIMTFRTCLVRVLFKMRINFDSFLGYHIHDLHGRASHEEFVHLAQKWTFNLQRNPQDMIINNCDPVSFTTPEDQQNWNGQLRFLGGLGKFGDHKDQASITYTNLPSHNKIYLSIVFVFFGDWGEGYVHVKIDGQPYSMQPKNNGINKLCWTTPTSNNPTRSDARGFEYILEIAHSNSNLKLLLEIDTFASRGTSLAFNNVKIYLDSRSIDTNKVSKICHINHPKGCDMDSKISWDNSFCPNGFFAPPSCSQCSSIGALCTHCTRQDACADCSSGQIISQRTSCHPCSIDQCDKCEDKLVPIFGYTPVCKLCKGSWVLYDGRCYERCPKPSHIVKGMSDQGRECIEPCPAGKYMSWNFTCINSCSFPLLKVDDVNQGLICEFPCAKYIKFLYLNGSCLDTCPEELTRKETGGFQFCDQGQNLVNAIINEKNVTLVMDTVSMYPYKTKKFGAFDIETSWTFFSIDEEDYDLYSIQNWASDVECGGTCQSRRCGIDCDWGYLCDDSHGKENNFFCWWPFGEKKNNFCYNLYSKGNETFKAYKIKPFASITLTNYGGPGNFSNFVDDDFSKWFTITNQVNNQSFASNGMIIDFETKKDYQDLRYAPSENRVVLKQQLFELYNKTPYFEVNWNNSKCDHKTKRAYLPRTIHLPDPSKIFDEKHEEKTIFGYQILSQARIAEFTSLEDIPILTPISGMQKWKRYHHQKQGFFYLDPCNQQFLNLQFDSLTGNYFVYPPGHQKLNDDKFICIAISETVDFDDDTRGLVLYELFNGTDTWKRSTRFTGILTNDYLSEITLKVTSSAQPKLNFTDDDDDSVTISINHESSQPRINLKTNYPMICDIYISKQCTFRLVTTKEQLTAFKQVSEDCGKWYERSAYQCDGMLGYLYPPNNLVAKKIRDFTISRTVRERQDFDVVNFNQPTNSRFWIFFMIIFLFLVIFLGYFSYRRLEKKKLFTQGIKLLLQ